MLLVVVPPRWPVQTGPNPLYSQSCLFNEWTPAPGPLARGAIRTPPAYAQGIGLAALGLAAGWPLGKSFVLTLCGLWLLAWLYNIPPVRTKDLPYVEVLSEALNNPVRMLAGWYLTGTAQMRYRLELILTFPLIAWVLAAYLSLGFDEDSAAQHPEKLYRQPRLMIPLTICWLAMIWLLFLDVPQLREAFPPSLQ